MLSEELIHTKKDPESSMGLEGSIAMAAALFLNGEGETTTFQNRKEASGFDEKQQKRRDGKRILADNFAIGGIPIQTETRQGSNVVAFNAN